MGNRMCGGWSRRGPLEERLTRPQRLARQPSGVDYKKLRKLILSQKLAPCFDALDDPNLLADLEECPICFFYYPSLNRSRCCAKGICTECFVQMKPSDTAHPAQCPFCKSSCYAVEYRGARTEEEKILERVEEQKVIEAKIRMQSEAQIEERVMHVEQPHSLLEIMHAQSNFGEPSCGLIEETDIEETWASVMRENIMVDGSSDPSTCCTRHEELNADLEEIMVMEAIWQSLQNCRLHRSEISQTSGWSETVGTSRDSSSSDTSFPCDQGESSSSHLSADGVAVAIARLAEGHLQQHQVSEQDCVRAQTSEELCEYFVEGSNRTQSEIGSNMTQMRLLQ